MGLFSKSSPKKSEQPDTKENKTSSSRSSPQKSPSKSSAKSSRPSPTKSIRHQEQTHRNRSRSRRTHRTHYSADTHPLNLPPDERERRRTAMSSDGEQDEEMYQMDVDSDTSGIHQQPNGISDRDQMNGDGSPVPPPHKTPSPPPKPAYDPELCKATGNKYFKAKDYTKAVQEYTKGTESPSDSRTVASLHV